ncbi:MAG: hypothetical protein FJY88_02275 [Candidatus Eisenbacteria bacterium]|nr:hypothetical protein [Candidatus Eisenbacteria bacterium]
MKALAVRILLPAIALAGIANLGFGAIPYLTWDDAEVVDSPVTILPSSSGASAIYWEGQWRVVYEKEGDIYLCTKDAAGWATPFPVADGASDSRNPHLADMMGNLCVVWEDDRSGHTEIWSRRLHAGQWTQEECLTCDDVSSRAPAVAATYYAGMVAWEDSTASSFRLWARTWSGTTWGPPSSVSTNPANARDPSLACSWMQTIFVSWADWRHGLPQIYVREWESGWGTQERTPPVSSPCRHPSIQSSVCCGDALVNDISVAYEVTEPDGITEVWRTDRRFYDWTVERVSTDDQIPSICPSTAGLDYSVGECGDGGYVPKYYETFTEVLLGGLRRHTAVEHPGVGADQFDVLTESGLDKSSIALTTDEQFADILVFYIEMRDGVPTLLVRHGVAPRYDSVVYETPRALLISPAGLPGTAVRAYNRCPIIPPPVGHALEIEFSAPLDAALTWDAGQEHPFVHAVTDSGGVALFSISGGGCSQAGSADLSCDGFQMPLRVWPGAKSPDVNGDCVVLEDDVAYVKARLGSNDFCADLDGSGLVNETDLALVEATLGDICPSLAAIEDTREGRTMSLTSSPNPASRSVVLRLWLPVGGERAQLRIVDAGGRLVRSWNRGSWSAGTNTVLWDLRDISGRSVCPGIYFATAASGKDRSSRMIAVVK